VILEAVDWPIWLGEEAGDHLALLRPAESGVVRLWPVSRAVNSVRNNGAELLDCIDDPSAPPPSDALAEIIRPKGGPVATEPKLRFRSPRRQIEWQGLAEAGRQRTGRSAACEAGKRPSNGRCWTWFSKCGSGRIQR